MVNFRLEGFAHLGSPYRKNQSAAAGIDHVDSKAVDSSQAVIASRSGFAKPKRAPNSCAGQPVMEVWRTLGLEFIDELLERFSCSEERFN